MSGGFLLRFFPPASRTHQDSTNSGCSFISQPRPFPAIPNIMKTVLLSLFFSSGLFATTISVVPVYEPLSLHGTDVDAVISDTGEALQATVLPRAMALTGAFPEVLIEAIRTPHKLPTNNPNYKVEEANVLVLCNVSIGAELTDEGLVVKLDVRDLDIPAEVDLTSRQLLKITLVALQRTLEEYNSAQTDPLNVSIVIDGTNENNATLKDLEATIAIPPKP